MQTSFIRKQYVDAACTQSDINLHVPTLRMYASQCVDVVEMGAWAGVSTWGMLQGLVDAAKFEPGVPRSLTGIDSRVAPAPYLFTHVEDAPDIAIFFQEGDVLRVEGVTCDLLFIDTLHVYGQLKRELALHAPGTRKFIILHDTTVDATHGEALRVGWDPAALAARTGIPVQEITTGLWPAVEEFLASHPEWKLRIRYTNNNGLTILERVSTAPSSGVAAVDGAVASDDAGVAKQAEERSPIGVKNYSCF